LIDYELPPPWLHELDDPMDEHGYVHVSQRPGLGMNINFDFIQAHQLGA
jgi:L-alanine-DL-glutamate epimerase-like enolase superfamily enzyme